MAQRKMSLILNCTTCKYNETKILQSASQNLTFRFVVCSNLYISILFTLSIILLTKLCWHNPKFLYGAKLCCAKGQSTVLYTVRTSTSDIKDDFMRPISARSAYFHQKWMKIIWSNQALISNYDIGWNHLSQLKEIAIKIRSLSKFINSW